VAATSEPRVIKFLVGDRSIGKFGFTWRIGSGGTSFYIKPLAGWAQEIKVSLHGPDPSRGLTGGYKIELDKSAAASVHKAGGALAVQNNWPDKKWFSGYEVHPGVDLVLRLRFPWDLFDQHAVSAEVPSSPRPTDLGVLVPVPQREHAVDVDVFVCHATPYWPNKAQARLDNACLGPVANKAGQFLTAQTVHRSLDKDPSPTVPDAPVGASGMPPLHDRLRGMGAAVDPHGFLWVHEMWLSHFEMQKRTLKPFWTGG
jgi:hypothetical protein